ncbi:hypothetical protein ACTXT7_010432 [Hymenolepis weldensis]
MAVDTKVKTWWIVSEELRNPRKELDFEDCLLVVSLPPLKMLGLGDAPYPKDDIPTFQPPWPILIKPAKAKHQTWRLGFCLNGHPFSNGNPEQDACAAWQLPRWWDITAVGQQRVCQRRWHTARDFDVPKSVCIKYTATVW